MSTEYINTEYSTEIPVIKTRDPKVVVRSIARSECNRMHYISDMMIKVRDMQKAPEFNSKFCSSNSPECLNDILDKLIYMFHCESNCGLMGLVESVSSNPIEQTVIDYDKIEEDKHV